jgi:transposase
VRSVGCWSHIRRYFIRAGDAHPELASWTASWVERIGALYVAHTAMAAAPAGSSAHTWAAAQFSAALNTIDAQRTAQSSHPDLLHPAAAKVLATLDREWDGLARHREFPELALDNNTSERALRGPVVGRKNYYGSGSVVSAELASRVWTITTTAQRAGLNPLTYLRAYLDACAQAGGTAPDPETLTRFLPWAATSDDLAAWAHDPQPNSDTSRNNTAGNDTRPPSDHPRTGPAP